MNKLKTIGLSALAGSLAVTTASNAVEYALSGDAYVVYSSEDDTTTEAASGKTFAADMDLYTNASTELDNGFTVSFFQGINTVFLLSYFDNDITKETNKESAEISSLFSIIKKKHIQNPNK